MRPLLAALILTAVGLLAYLAINLVSDWIGQVPL